MDELPDALEQLITEVAPGNTWTDLGGWISHNLLLEPSGLVLRLHPPEASRRRLLAVQRVRAALAEHGFMVPVARAVGGSTALRCADSWAELEPFLPHERLPRGWDTYHWMFQAMGVLHRTLRTLDLSVPRPRDAVFVAPRTLHHWAQTTAADTTAAEKTGTATDPQLATEMAEAQRQRRQLVARLRRLWVPAHQLPRQLVHGDIKLPNLGRSPDGRTVYLDFGFLAMRPRIHDLAFSLTHTILTAAEDQVADPTQFAWDKVPDVIAAYEEGAGVQLTPLERRALAPYTATVRAFSVAYADIVEHPSDWRRYCAPNLAMATWLLDHPEALTP